MLQPATTALLTGSIPIVAMILAYLANIMAGTELESRFICQPFWDGCVSISRAARSGPGLHIFRAIMLPCAVLLLFSWIYIRDWLTGLAVCSHSRARAPFILGVIGAVFLVFYVTWLGTDGEWYRWLRRYGVIFYFAGTALAQLFLVAALWPVRLSLAEGRLATSITTLTVLVSLQWGLGIASVAKRLLISDPVLMDRIENVIEWTFALPMVLAFLVVAWMFRLTGFSAQTRLDPPGGRG